jgi:hypothetical protein
VSTCNERRNFLTLLYLVALRYVYCYCLKLKSNVIVCKNITLFPELSQVLGSIFTEILIELCSLGAAIYETGCNRYSLTSYSLKAATGSVLRATYCTYYTEPLIYLASMIGHFTESFA